MTDRTFLSGVIAATLALMTSGPTHAQSIDDIISAELLTGWRTGAETRMAALYLKLAPGWKTYWRAPGDAGIPPQFDWSGSRNVAGAKVHWPTPGIFDTMGYRTIGYTDDFVLPIEFTPRRPGEAFVIQGRVDLGVCETICVPASVQFNAVINGPGASDPMIHDALASQPVPGRQAGVRRVTCQFEAIEDGLRLEAAIDMPRLGREAAVVEAGDPRIWVSEAQADRRGGALQITADLVPPYGEPLSIDRSELRFTVLGRNQAVDIVGCTD